MQKHYKNVKLLKTLDATGFLMGDIIVTDGKISYVGESISMQCDEEYDLQGKIVMPSFKNLSCDLRGLSSSEAEKVIMSNIASGVTEIIAITDDLILCKYLFNKLSLTWKVAYPYSEALPNEEDLDKVLLFADPVVDEENVLDEISDFSAKNGCQVFVDLFGNLRETGELNSSTGQLPINYIENFGLLDRGGYLSGAICSDKEDYRLLGEYNFKVVTRPVSDLRKGNGFANIVQIQNAGLDLAFGSGDDKEVDFFQIGRSVLLGTRGLLCDGEVLDEREVLSVMSRTEALEEGQDADFIVVDNTFETIEDVVNHASKRDIEMTIAKGKIIYNREVKDAN